MGGSCPPELEYFRHIDQLVVKQIIELFEGENRSVAFNFLFFVLFLFELMTALLTRASKLLMSEFISVLTGFETQNRYRVFNSMGQQVFFIQEGKKYTRVHTSMEFYVYFVFVC